MCPSDLGGRGSMIEARRLLNEEVVELTSWGCTWGEPEDSSGTAHAKTRQ